MDQTNENLRQLSQNFLSVKESRLKLDIRMTSVFGSTSSIEHTVSCYHVMNVVSRVRDQVEELLVCMIVEPHFLHLWVHVLVR